MYNAAALHDEYMQLWSTMQYKDGYARMAEKVAARLCNNLDRYMAIQRLTNVPAAFIMCAHERESSGDFATYLGNGQRLDRVTTIVPIGRGPFGTFEEGAIDALRLEKMGGIALTDWDESMLSFWGETFNGFGYRMKGLRSPYLWGGTNHQQSGKYTSDNHFDVTVLDPQLGMMAVYGAILKLHPELDLGGAAGGPIWLNQAPPLVPTLPAPSAPVPTTVYVFTGAQRGSVKQLQQALDDLGAQPLIDVDGYITKQGETYLALKALVARIEAAQ